MHTHRFKSIANAVASALFFAIPGLLGAATPPALAEVIRTNITFPAGANRTVSRSFVAPRGAPVTARVTLRHEGVFGQDPDKTVTLRLFKPNGDQAGGTQLVLRLGYLTTGPTGQRALSPHPTRTNAAFVTQFPVSFTAGETCGNWKVVISNPNDQATAAPASGSIEFTWKPPAIPIQTIGPFSVPGTPGSRVTRSVTIPQSGAVNIVATWNSGPLKDYKLKFRLIKPGGQVVKEAEGYSNGTVNPALGSQKLKLSHNVTQEQAALRSNWTLEVLRSEGAVQSVTVKRTFQPNCY